MTTIGILSDLHLDFGSEPHIKLPDTDILLLAGDIIETKYLLESQTDARSRGCRVSMKKFCARVQAKGYKHVLAIAGNHEFYSFEIHKTHTVLNNFYKDYGIEYINNDFVIRSGIMFVGSTLWTDFNNGCPIAMGHVGQRMNDYRHIKIGNRLFTTEEALREHRKAVASIVDAIEWNAGKYPVVVFTHHAPSEQSVDSRYKHDTLMNYGYYSNLEDKMEGVDVWFHGHMHDPKDYIVGNTQVICNPYGYQGYETRKGMYDVDLKVEIT